VSSPTIEVDGNACIAGWGPCESVGMWAAHECKRPAGHDGRHVCVCGSWSLVEMEVSGE
jgi:hypothetical protein